MEFGTGTVKLSHAHSRHNWDIGRRHNLQSINILNDEGTLNEAAEEQFRVRVRMIGDLMNANVFFFQGYETIPCKSSRRGGIEECGPLHW